MNLFQRLVAQLQAALPMLLAAGMAGFTWWLIQATPKDDGPTRPALASSNPDYVLNEAHIARFDAKGRLQAVIDGRSIRHYPVQDELQIDQLVLSARNEKGQGLHAVARQGVATGQAEVVTILGGAKVVATPASAPRVAGKPVQGPIRLSGEVFKVDTRQHVLTADRPITLEHESGEIHAQAMRHDQRTGITELQGRVTGHYKGQP